MSQTQQDLNASVKSATISFSVIRYSYRSKSFSRTSGGTGISPHTLSCAVAVRTVCRIDGAQNLKLALDVRVKVFDEVKMVWAFLPRKEVVYTVLVSNIAPTTNVRERLYVCVDSSKEEAVVRDVPA